MSFSVRLFSAVVFVVVLLHGVSSDSIDQHLEEKHGVKYASECEVCKIVSIELQSKLEETGKSREVLETGYAFDSAKPKKRTEYAKSELRLVESLDDVCSRVLEYNIHKERSDSSRFSRGMSETFKTLHGLVDKGVKVELGIPQELWDKPSAEVTHLKTQCESLIETYESDIEEWYFGKQETSLEEHLCRQRALAEKNSDCLTELSTANNSGSSENGKPETGSKRPKTEL